MVKEETFEVWLFPKYDSCLYIGILSKENTKYIKLLKASICPDLELESHTCNSFIYLQLKKRFPLCNKNCGFETAKNKFEMLLCTNDEHLIAEVYKRLLQLNLEIEYVKQCLIQWARRFGYNI